MNMLFVMFCEQCHFVDKILLGVVSCAVAI